MKHRRIHKLGFRTMFVPLSLLYTVEEVGVLLLSLYALLDPLTMSCTDRLINEANEVEQGDSLLVKYRS